MNLWDYIRPWLLFGIVVLIIWKFSMSFDTANERFGIFFLISLLLVIIYGLIHHEKEKNKLEM